MASAAKAAFALATAVMISTVFTSCSKDNDDDPKPEPKANTVTIDGAERPILKAEYEDYGDGNYNLYLSAESTEGVGFQLNKKLHMTGNPITLTEKEKKHDGKWYWSISYNNPGGLQSIDTFADPNSDKPVFKTGTLTISGSPESTLNIKLENGRVEGTDDKEHTLTISYSGTMTKK